MQANMEEAERRIEEARRTPQDLLGGETGAAWMRARRDPERLLEAARRAATPFAW